MTGRERMEAAFSEEGARETPVVLCYEDVFIRDHWVQLTSAPWHHQFETVLDVQLSWRREVLSRLPQDWLLLEEFYSQKERECLKLEVRPEGVFRIDSRSGQEQLLQKPSWSSEFNLSLRPVDVPGSFDEVDRRIAGLEKMTWGGVYDGRDDLARCLRSENPERVPMFRINGPLWRCYELWGFEPFMMAVASQPDLVAHACRRFVDLCIREIELAAYLGAEIIWIEDCFIDMIFADAYARLNLPSLSQVVSAIRRSAMKSVYYFSGNPAGKESAIRAVGADAFSFEESKKGFVVDIAELAEYFSGDYVLFGNLDAIGVLQDAPEDRLREEIFRQLEAGKRNRGRFVMSMGSPVTPATPLERVQRYFELSRDLGRPD